jgi:hypothetical protein
MTACSLSGLNKAASWLGKPGGNRRSGLVLGFG